MPFMDSLRTALTHVQASGERLQQCYNEAMADWRAFDVIPDCKDLAEHASKTCAKCGEAVQLNEELKTKIATKIDQLHQESSLKAAREAEEQARIREEWERARQQREQQEQSRSMPFAGRRPTFAEWAASEDEEAIYPWMLPRRAGHADHPYGNPYHGTPMAPQPLQHRPKKTPWEVFVDNKNPDYATLSQFPDPSTATQCRHTAACDSNAAGRALKACDCQIEDAVEKLTGLNLKAERVKWHPDRFLGCEEGVREEMKRKAELVFKVVNEMYEKGAR